ncbi:transposase [Streptomyces goshikiensis]|uniref:IS110 family transposase n=1 Tax=Streptomyces goshikiensis TaxID=1942 RepID=UPI00365312FC
MFDTAGAGAFLGTGVGKTTHHDQGPVPAGKKAFYKPMPNSEPERRTVFDNLKAKFGTPRWAPIDALPLTMARIASCQATQPPRLSMRRTADPYLGEAKTDAKYAAAITDAARTTPRTPRSLELAAELTVPSSFGQYLAAEATRTNNRIRDPLTLPWTRN